jgi:8-oxo-dGTP pyrophosphatase MutT (NUDIX family)
MPHIHEKIDFAAEVFVVHNNKVLLRLHDKYKMWLSVGGHIELDEDPNMAAVREVKEEVGLDITLWDGNKQISIDKPEFTELTPPVAMNRHPINETHTHISMIYFATATTDVVVPEKETDEWRWLGREDLDSIQDLREDIRFYAKRALEILK